MERIHFQEYTAASYDTNANLSDEKLKKLVIRTIKANSDKSAQWIYKELRKQLPETSPARIAHSVMELIDVLANYRKSKGE